MCKKKIYNHITNKLSQLDKEFIKHIPEGGNWKHIPLEVAKKSKRLMNIFASGGRTTYYGRLSYDKPAYTITTYFNRPGNGCYIHPRQDRLISFREAARLQSFPDNFVFSGPKTSKLKQIGNAVPPLLGYHIARYLEGEITVDLFSGVGGLSLGFLWAGKKIVSALEKDKNIAQVYKNNIGDHIFIGDAFSKKDFELFVEYSFSKSTTIEIVIGGPPCQGFSLAGNLDSQDARNFLLLKFLDFVEVFRPNIFLLENVVGLKSKRYQFYMSAFYEKVKKLGYITSEPMVLNAASYGVPQLRKRLFIIGALKSRFLASLREISNRKYIYNKENFLTVYDAISDLPPICENFQQEVFEINDWCPKTIYQAFLGGTMSIEEFLYELDLMEKKLFIIYK
jgi:DNA (cytosine-5)-methyltransferase 1